MADPTTDETLSRDERGLHPRVRIVWWVGWIVSDVFLLALLIVAVLVVDANTERTIPAGLPWSAVALGAAIVLARTWYAGALYRVWRYRFTDDGLELRYGVLWKRASAMPYRRLQQVDVQQGPLERRLGLSSMQLRSAAATTDATIPGVADADVEPVRRLLMQRAGRDDGT
ncbi:MAG: PH domain-containing protein [Ilumatobacteraceae bacterium]